MRPIMLASFLVACAATSVAAQNCEIPPAYANQVVVEEGDLRVRYATDRSMYNPADNVQLYLVVENIGATTFSINWGIDPQDGHFILRPGFETFEECCSNMDDFANVLIYLPSLIQFFSPGTTLDPGECRVWQRTISLAWVTEEGAPAPDPGRYAVLGGMFQMVDFSPQNSTFIAPQGGAKLYINVIGPVSTTTSTWGRIKAFYR